MFELSVQLLKFAFILSCRLYPFSSCSTIREIMKTIMNVKMLKTINVWFPPSTCASYTNMFMMFSQCWWVNLHVKQLCECCQHMTNTIRMKDFYYSFHLELTINTAKSLTPSLKLQNFIWCYSISCLSLWLDRLSYIVIDDRDAL